MSIKFVDFSGTPFVHYLLPVIPRGVPLSDKSTLDPEKLGKTPGLFNIREGTWSGYAWQNDTMREEQLRAVDRWYKDQPASIIAIQASELCGLDVDFDREDLAAIAYEIAIKVFGWAPKRIRTGSHKFLMCYRRKEGSPFITKHRLAIEHVLLGLGMGKHACEFLGKGQQYLLSGQHMDGSFYVWEKTILGGPGDPISWGWDSIPEVTNADVARFYAELLPALEAVGWIKKKLSLGSGNTEQVRHAIGPDHPGLAPSLELLGRALDAIPVDDDDLLDYDQWFRFLAALKAACGGDETFYLEHIEPWSNANPNNVELTRPKWESVREAALGWDFIARMAQAHGFTEHLIEEFETLPPLTVDTTAADGTTTMAPAPTGPTIPFYVYNQITKRWIDAHGANMCYVPGKTGGDWRECKDGVWEVTHTAATSIRDFCEQTGQTMQASASLSAAQTERANALLDAGNSAVTVERQIRTHERFVRKASEFDISPYVMGAPGGYIDEKGVLRPADPALMLTRRVLCAPNRLVLCPRFKQLVKNLANHDAEVEHALQMFIGYTLCGLPNQKLFPFLLGLSDTGKSQLMIILSKLMGGQAGGYARRAATATFMQTQKQSQFAQRTFDLSDLDGYWFVYISEIAKGMTMNEPLIKDITGGDNVYAEAKYGDGRDLNVRFVPWIAANHFPRVVTPDTALRNRLALFKCEIVIPKDRQDKHFAQHVIDEEGPGVMALCLEWRNEFLAEGGIILPPSMLAERDARFAKSDKMRLFLEARGEFEPDAITPKQGIYDCYKRWCKDDHYEAEGRSTFYENLQEHELFRSRGCSYRKTRVEGGSVDAPQHVLQGWRMFGVNELGSYSPVVPDFEVVEDATSEPGRSIH